MAARGRLGKAFGLLTAALGSLLLVSSFSSAGGSGKQAFHKGTYEKGKLHVNLYRGAAVPLELSVIPTPDNCNNHIDLDLKWDEEKNEVTVHLKGKNVLEPFPDVDRTPGVNFKPNPHFPEPEDIVDGRYQPLDRHERALAELLLRPKHTGLDGERT